MKKTAGWSGVAIDLLVVFFCLTFASSVSMAQQAAATNNDEEEKPPQMLTFREDVIVGARPIASPTAAVTVIDHETIESANVRSAAELLQYVAGVHVVSNGARGGHTTVQVRGGDPNFTLVLLDGIPLNNPTGIEGGAFNLASLPVTNIERVEVVRGPLSYFYGSSALSGVVNIVTRRGKSRGPRLEASIEGGTPSQLRAATSFSGTVGRGDYYVGAVWDQEDERIGNDTFKEANVQGSFGIPIANEGNLRLSTRFAWWKADDYQEASGGPVFGTGELRHSENRDLSLGADLSISSTSRWKQRITASFNRHDTDRTSPGVAPLVPPSLEAPLFSRTRLGWLSTFDVASNVQASGGVNLEHEDGTNDSVLFLPPFLGGEVSGDYSLSRTTPGVFTELVTELGRFFVEAGLRADIPQNLDTAWSPRLAVRYRVGDNTVLRGTLSRAFRLPSFTALGSPPALGGNPELRPETSVGADVGVEHEVDSWRLTTGLGTFYNRYNDLIDFDFDTFKFTNRSRVRSSGLELSLAWKPAPNFELETDLTWQNVEDLDVPEKPLHQPDWIGSTRFTWKPWLPFTLRFEGNFVSKSFDRQLPVPDRDSVDGYAVFDLAAAWRFSDSWQIRVRLDNLADADYETFIGFPGPGRSAKVAVQYTLR